MNLPVYTYSLAASMALVWLTAHADPSAEDWPLCPSALPIPDRPPVEGTLEPGDIQISADEADIEEAGISFLRGNVQITQDGKQISADNISYDQQNESAEMSGSVQYWDEDMYLHSDTGHVDFTAEQGDFNDARFVLRGNRARGNAGTISHTYPTMTNLSSVDYTTCDPEDNFWKLSASEIKLNHEEKWGSAKNVIMRIKDVPVLYTPYISFPLSNERKTGFLFPSAGTTNRNGFEFITPFYWNIAPHMDATITPRVLTDSGLMMQGEFRYLVHRGGGEFHAEYLPSDSQFQDEDRNLFSFKHNQEFGETGNLFLTYNRVSDKQFFEDFGSNLRLTSTRFLERRAEASYKGDWWHARALAQDYQTVDRSIPQISRPYKRLPQVSFSAFSPFRNRQLNFRLDTDVSFFDRGDNNAVPNDVNGLRYDLYPSVSYPVHTAGSFIEPRVGVRFTQYHLDDSGSTFKSNPNRFLPVVSLDSGMFFERKASIFNNSYTQTLEPRLFYLFVPDDNQGDLPVFDTGLYDFSFDSLFRDNRFTGPDRMGDANQVTVAVTSRFLNQESGREAGYVSLGQTYYFDDRDVFLVVPGIGPGLTGVVRTEEGSPFIAEVGTSLLGDFNFRGTVQYDFFNGKTEELAAFAQYKPATDKVVNLGYRVRRTSNSLSSPYGGTALTDIEQSEVSFHWPLGRNWSMVGLWTHAVPENRILEIFGGLEYEDCCWAFRAVARRFLTDVNQSYNNGIFFQVEFKGLAGIGKKTAEFLEENIPGYQRGF